MRTEAHTHIHGKMERPLKCQNPIISPPIFILNLHIHIKEIIKDVDKNAGLFSIYIICITVLELIAESVKL